jgi:catalase
VTLLGQCDRPIQERMVWHLLMAEDELGLRVGEGLGIKPDDVRHLEPLPRQVFTAEEHERLANLGANGTRDVRDLQMTHCVPNERVVVER